MSERPSAPSTDQHELMQQMAGLFRAERVFTAVLDNDLKDTGLNVREVYTLTLLAQSVGYTMSMTDLTDAMHLPKSVTTTRIGRFEKMGLVVRHNDEHDRRRVMVVMTAKGTRVQEIAFGIMMQSVSNRLLQHLTEEDVASLERMNRVSDAVHGDHERQQRAARRRKAYATA